MVTIKISETPQVDIHLLINIRGVRCPGPTEDLTLDLRRRSTEDNRQGSTRELPRCRVLPRGMALVRQPNDTTRAHLSTRAPQLP